MALNFRLSAKQGSGYTDLFSRTSIEGIVDVDTEFIKVPLTVTIPAADKGTQNITITTDEKMPNSMFEVYLNTTGEDAIKAYSTLTQVSVTTNQLTVIRLYQDQTTDIEVTLMFYEK